MWLVNKADMTTNDKIGKPVADRSEYIPPHESGLSRREFIQQSGAAALLAGLTIYKPVVAKTLKDNNPPTAAETFSPHQQAVLQTAQEQLFPADGDGPSAREINALPYLEWALTDPANIEDGDREFLSKGTGWLDALSMETYELGFTKLSSTEQHELMQQFSETERGENWMSLLIYYLLEALLLDPVYGGNPDGLGWKWLQHQPGFPRPGKDQTYRRYQT